mmetsp:Transcript_1401/g.1906  ORF Transcript_1401/g.1906 Transcript_1401/m.1906 type:complete len:213 (-) Transcript_1401:443-1081(-)
MGHFVHTFTLFWVLFCCFSNAFLAPYQRSLLKDQLKKACKSKDLPKIEEITENLKKVNPTTDIKKDFSKLKGEWKLLYTTAPESEVPDESKGIKTYQSIDTDEGVIYNVIDRGLPEKGLQIGVGAEPTRRDRVALDFRTIEIYNTSFPKKLTLYFPPRQFFKFIAQVSSKFTGKQFDEQAFKEIAHFDVLYLDNDLRVQKNSEGNLFVNCRI